MTKRTRLFFFVAGGILVAGLGTGLVASYMGVQGLNLLGGDGPAELAYVPADTRMLAYANVRHVMTSELRQTLGDLRPGAEQGADRFEHASNLRRRAQVAALADLRATAHEHVRIDHRARTDPRADVDV